MAPKEPQAMLEAMALLTPPLVCIFLEINEMKWINFKVEYINLQLMHLYQSSASSIIFILLDKKIHLGDNFKHSFKKSINNFFK